MTQHLLEARPYPLKVSIVMPIYNEGPVASILRKAIVEFLPEIRCEVEVILVNDGSSDDSLAQLVAWAREDSRIRVLHLSRNFGHQAAATAGLEAANGEAVVLMDADLQDPFEVIHLMIEKYCEGFDIVFGQRETREGESSFKRFTAWAFYRFMRKFIHPDLPVDTGDFRLMSRLCIDGLNKMGEIHRFLRGMVAWIGFSQCAVLYRRAARAAGDTKYPLLKMIRLAWTAATSFSDLPLKLSFYLGLLGLIVAFEETARALMANFFGWYLVSGWTSIVILVCMFNGLILISIGLIGDYIGKIYIESKGRPVYLVAKEYHFGKATE